MALCDTAVRLLDTIASEEVLSPTIAEVHEMARMAKDRRDQAQLLLIAVSMAISLNGKRLGRMVVVRNCEQVTVKLTCDTKGVRCPKGVLAKALDDMGWEEDHVNDVHSALFGSSNKHRSVNSQDGVRAQQQKSCQHRRSTQHRSRRAH